MRAPKVLPENHRAVGLKWADVDLDGGMLQVRRIMSETRTGRMEEETKRGEGRRMYLSAKDVEYRKIHHERQCYEAETTRGYEDHGLVFPSFKGTTTNPKNLYVPELQAPPEVRGAAKYSISGSPAHVRYNTAHGRQASQVRSRDVRTRQHLYHAGHLQPRDRRHGRWARGCYGRCALMAIAAALLPPGVMAFPGCGEIRIDKLMRP